MRHKEQKSGFALIVSLSLMAFVLLLMLSLSTIVQVETQSSSIARQSVQAKTNALLGLQIAIGEIQQNLGADQRISARADIFGNTHQSKSHLTGVWSSVAGAQLGGQTYQKGEFIRWLVSGGGNEAWRTGAVLNPVTLVGAGSLSDSNDDGVADTPNDVVTAELQPIQGAMRGGSSTEGHYAWWVGDEGVKARINIEDQTLDSVAASPVEKKLNSALALDSSGRSDVGVLPGLQSIDIQEDGLAGRVSELDDVALSVADSKAMLDVVNGYFHDLTTVSSGVLTDVKNGGLKQDLSLAFEMADADFDGSVFGSSGPDTVMSTGFGQVQPIFRTGPNGDTNGPTWHVLRDYYSIYKRMDSVMLDPVFDAQALWPNNDALAPIIEPASADGQWRNLATMRYVMPFAVQDKDPSKGSSDLLGDPLRSNGSYLPIPVKSSYLPYVQRHITTVGAVFNPFENAGLYRQMQVTLDSAVVVHNPYNVKIRHDGLASAFEKLSFDATVETLAVDAAGADKEIRFKQGGGFEYGKEFTRSSTGNKHIIKTAGGTMDPGELKVYSALEHDDDSNYSESRLLESNEYLVLKDAGRNAFLNLHLPVDESGDGGPDISVSVRPNLGTRYQYWAFHCIAPSGGAVPLDLDIRDIRNGREGLHNYGGFRSEDIAGSIASWHGGDDPPRSLTTGNYLLSGFNSPIRVEPFGLFQFDAFLKPAEKDSEYNPFPYPGLSHTNPLAPISQLNNLFDTDHVGGSTDDYGYPVLSPNWQVRIRTNIEEEAWQTKPGKDGLNAFWGDSSDSLGKTHVAAIELPTTPPLSLGQFQNANVSMYAHMPALAIGNSLASPYVPRNQTETKYFNSDGKSRAFYDLSYLSNEVLWDSYFFSSYSLPYDDRNDNFRGGEVQDSFDAAFDSSNPDYRGWLPNPRMTLRGVDEDLNAIRGKLFQDDGSPDALGYTRAAENLMVAGAFNVNSVSFNAWKAVLSSARNIPVFKSEGLNELDYIDDSTPLSRITLPIHGDYNNRYDLYSDESAWGGVGTLTDAQIDSLAQSIVDEIKARVDVKGRPYISLGEFVNRELATGTTGLAGVLQAAIDSSGINASFEVDAPDNIKVGERDLSGDYEFPTPENIFNAEGAERSTATSASAFRLQADILQAIGSFASVRSDTFRIRTYGDYVDPITGDTSRAWCEAVIQRIPKPVEGGSADPSQTNYWIPNDVDQGRKFEIISFRWLNENEV